MAAWLAAVGCCLTGHWLVGLAAIWLLSGCRGAVGWLLAGSRLAAGWLDVWMGGRLETQDLG